MADNELSNCDGELGARLKLTGEEPKPSTGASTGDCAVWLNVPPPRADRRVFTEVARRDGDLEIEELAEVSIDPEEITDEDVDPGLPESV